VEVEEDALAELDVRSVIAEEGRLHPDRLTAAPEQLAQDRASHLGLAFPRGVQGLAEVAGALATGDELGVERVVQFTGEHFLTFAGHHVPTPVPSRLPRGLRAG